MRELTLRKESEGRFLRWKKGDSRNMYSWKLLTKKIAIWMIVCVMLVGICPVQAQAATESMTIYGIYVDKNNKGDAVLLKSAGEYLLMDLGLYDNIPALCDQLDSAGITHFKLYFSHLHIDHVGGKKGDFMAGLQYMQKRGYKIDFLYLADPALAPESDDYGKKYELLRQYMEEYFGGEQRMLYLKKGSQFAVGYAAIEVLGPSLEYVQSVHPTDYANKVPDDEAETEAGQSIMMTYYENNCSLVSRISCAGRSYLTAGDMLKVEANYLVKEYGDLLKSDIYKLSHHGTALGNTQALLNLIDPAYTFAINNGNTHYDEELKQWAFNRSLVSAKPVSMPYYVANEQKTIAYRVSDGKISLYQGETLGDLKKVKGWIAVYGADGINRDKDYYYIGADGVPLTGVQEIEGKKYYYTNGGCMEYGGYDENGVYSGWKEYDIWKHRYFKLEKDSDIAVMLTGFHRIDGQLYYFDTNGWKEEGGDEPDFIVIQGNSYVVNEDGIFSTDIELEFNGKRYYFNHDGVMLTNSKIELDGEYYYYGKYGSRVASVFVKIDGNSYYFDEQGKMVHGGTYLLGGKEYYFGDDGIMACRQKVKIGSKYYYYGKYGTKVSDVLVKIGAYKYYFDEEGVMVKNQFVELGTNAYYFDKKGRMVVKQFVEDEDGNKYYFGKKGTMVKSKSVKIGKETYTFDENGIMVTEDDQQDAA